MPSPAGTVAKAVVPTGASVAATGGVTALIRSPFARRMLELVLAEPLLLTPEERYLYGHYLAYLLSGSRRRGLFLRRPLEPRNADRGRLLLGLTYACSPARPTKRSVMQPRCWIRGSRFAPFFRRLSWPSIWHVATPPRSGSFFDRPVAPLAKPAPTPRSECSTLRDRSIPG